MSKASRIELSLADQAEIMRALARHRLEHQPELERRLHPDWRILLDAEHAQDVMPVLWRMRRRAIFDKEKP
jgi:hypothetical protein